jgi:DNA invertase Pin-like site-specific DNA recombinase
MSTSTSNGLDLSGQGAAYIRVSEDQRDTFSQHTTIQGFAKKHGVTIPPQHWYEDQGWARDTADSRPDFQRLMQAVRAGRVNWIVIDSLDRFGMKNAKQLFSYLWDMEEAGCRLFDVTGKEWTGEDDATELTAWIGGKQSSKEQRDKSHRVVRGKVAKAQAGNWQGGPPPFAFDVACYSETAPDVELWRVVYEGGELLSHVRDTRGRKRPVKSIRRLKVYPDGREERYDGPNNFPGRDEKQVLRLAPSRDGSRVEAASSVFRRFATEAVSPSVLARDLNARGFRTAYGDYLQSNHVERMLRDPIYKGRSAYNRRHRGKFNRWAGGVPVPVTNYSEKETANDREDWVISEQVLFDPPIVDPDIWDRVQKKLDKQDRQRADDKKNKRGHAGRAPRSAEEYLTGLLYCQNCGGEMRARPVRRVKSLRYEYYCPTYHRHCRNGRASESRCRRNYAYQDHVEEYVKKWLDEAGVRWDILMREVRAQLKSNLPDKREQEGDRYWRAFCEGVARLEKYLAEHHPLEYGRIIEEDRAREELTREVGTCPDRGDPVPKGILDGLFNNGLADAMAGYTPNDSPRPTSQYIRDCLTTYRSLFDPGQLQQEIERLDAEHTRLTHRYADLPTPRAKEKAKAELAEIEAKLAQLEAQMKDAADSVESSFRELVQWETDLAEAKRAMNAAQGERSYRLLAEKLRAVISRIDLLFIATGDSRRGHQSSELRQVTIVPYDGGPTSFPVPQYNGYTSRRG